MIAGQALGLSLRQTRCSTADDFPPLSAASPWRVMSQNAELSRLEDRLIRDKGECEELDDDDHSPLMELDTARHL